MMKKKWSQPAIVLILIGIGSFVLQANLQLPMVALFLFGSGSFLCFLVGIVLSLIAIFKGELIIFIFFILALGLLAFTKPSEKAFTEWLNNKHDYECGPTECFRPSTETVTIVQKSSKDYIFFKKSTLKTMDEQGRLFLIEGRGILGMYYTATFKPVYE